MEREEGWRSMAIDLAETARALDAACRHLATRAAGPSLMAQVMKAQNDWDGALLRYDIMISQEEPR